MTAHRLTWILSLAVALAGSGLGCGDDKTAADASATGGRGGTTGGTGGAAGRGGTGGTAGRGGAGGAGGTAGTAGSTAGSGGSGSDASSDTSGTGGTGGTAGSAGTGGAGGTAGTGGGTDAAVDMPLPVDMAVDQPLPVDLPPDTQASSTVMVNDCAQFMCPQLTSIASQCQASETTCVHSKNGADQTNYCHSNGVKKVAHIVSAGGSAYTTTMEVFKANSGDDCYTLVIQGTGGGANDMQNWTFKSPAGATLATATWRASDERLVIRCDNVDYVIGDVGCPGTDGQPDDTGTECPVGTCSEP
jgi:hypothetical protein